MTYRLLFIGLLLWSIACGNNPEDKKAATNQKTTIKTNPAKVTFIELGSVRCIPCRAMQPVMKALEEEYGDQLKIVFYDVWLPEQRQYAQQYRIRVIPTQVFLDNKGNEFHRHEGFYPKEEIEALLSSKGLKKLKSVAN